MPLNQETIALGIVWITFLWVGRLVFKQYLAGPIADWLLRLGQVKYAMWFRRKRHTRSGCSGCGH